MSATSEERYTVKINRDVDTGNITEELWYNEQGRLGRRDGPAVQQFDAKTGQLVEEAWFHDGKLHREGDLPARTIIDFHRSDVRSEEWYLEGHLHRDSDQPAIVRKKISTDATVSLAWLQQGQPWRSDDLPTNVSYDPETGFETSEEYRVKGYLHRLTGPAIVTKDGSTGEVISAEYYHEGLMLDGAPDDDCQFEP